MEILCYEKIEIWKLKIMPKLKYFLWRILSQALGTTIRLNSIGIRIYSTCIRCGLAPETIAHMLFTCPNSVMIWRLANIPWNPSLSQDELCEEQITDLLHLQQQPLISTQLKLLPFWLMWRIWKGRCNLIFRKQVSRAERIVQYANADVSEWITTTKMDHPKQTWPDTSTFFPMQLH